MMRTLIISLFFGFVVSVPAYAESSISGKVSLAPKVAAKASPTDTVLIFARAAEGPRMPLAILQTQVKDLPMEFTLTDSMAMMHSMSLSNFDKVRVVARVSKSGSAMPASGDLEGTSKVVKPGSTGVQVVVDAVLP